MPLHPFKKHRANSLNCGVVLEEQRHLVPKPKQLTRLFGPNTQLQKPRLRNDALVGVLVVQIRNIPFVEWVAEEGNHILAELLNHL
jgi:hypothetical protein